MGNGAASDPPIDKRGLACPGLAGVVAPLSGVENAAMWSPLSPPVPPDELLGLASGDFSSCDAASAPTAATENDRSRLITFVSPPGETGAVAPGLSAAPDTAASAAAAGLGGRYPLSAARMNPKSDDPFDHASVSMMVSSSALKCFFTSLGIVVSARTNGSMMDDTSKASRPRSRGIAGNFSVAVLYDATTTSMEHASTDRTNRPEPSSASKPRRCSSVGGGGGISASSFCSAAIAAMSATDPNASGLSPPFLTLGSGAAGDLLVSPSDASGAEADPAWRITSRCSFSRMSSRK